MKWNHITISSGNYWFKQIATEMKIAELCSAQVSIQGELQALTNNVMKHQ